MFAGPVPMMFYLLARLALLLGIAILICLVILWGWRFVERRRQRVLSAPPVVVKGQHGNVAVPKDGATTPIRILAFSSPDCRPCRVLQTPALLRVAELRPDIVTIVDIDAPSSPELTERYQVLTVPTTVILDATGKAHAVNYGFANAQKLLQQVDAVVAHSVG